MTGAKLSLAKERIGTVKLNNYGSEMKVIEYKNSLDIVVEFPKHGYKRRTDWSEFIKGKIKSPYDKSVYGIGFIGKGNYYATVNGKPTIQYASWMRMMQRGYSSYEKKRHETYTNCLVADEWHNFQNFAQWFDDNYYEFEGERMELDKDILLKGNKTYSPETCVFVPKRINGLFLKSNARRGDLPIGVSFSKEKREYGTRFNIGNRKSKHVGYFDTPTEAFKAYKEHKELYIKSIANEYKDKIPKRLYDAMMAYKVEITD